MHQDKTLQPRDTVTRAYHLVKAQIIAGGVSIGALAKAARLDESTVSCYITGRRRHRAGQEAIHAAFCRLSGSGVRLATFWGDLLTVPKTERVSA